MRWVLPEIATMNIDQLRAFANGCCALATVPGNLDDARQRIPSMRNKDAAPDVVYALSILDKPAFAPQMAAARSEFLRG